MAVFSRIEVVETMWDIGVVPVFYDENFQTCKNVIKACYDGGARVFEFTNRGDFSDKVFEDLNHYVKMNLPDMILGVGSILDASTSAHFLQLGANFVVSPIVNPEMAKVCNRRKVAWLPGCGSVSEISFSQELGAELVKVFPAAQVGGPSFVKAVKGPLPWSSIMATGGIDLSEENLKEWFEAGVHCVGVGSKLFGEKKNGNYDYQIIKEKLESALALVKSFRS